MDVDRTKMAARTETNTRSVSKFVRASIFVGRKIIQNNYGSRAMETFFSGFNYLTEVIAGVKFKDGVEITEIYLKA